jgi:hypothetical protein
MTSVILWLFGVLTLASLIMIASWGRGAWGLWAEASCGEARLWRAVGVARWHRPFVIAASMTLHASGMAIGSGYRAWDMLHGFHVLGSDFGLLLANMTMIGFSKVGLVWGISIVPGTRRTRWPWWGFLILMVYWGVFCALWAAGWIAF